MPIQKEARKEALTLPRELERMAARELRLRARQNGGHAFVVGFSRENECGFGVFLIQHNNAVSIAGVEKDGAFVYRGPLQHGAWNDGTEDSASLAFLLKLSELMQVTTPTVIRRFAKAKITESLDFWISGEAVHCRLESACNKHRLVRARIAYELEKGLPISSLPEFAQKEILCALRAYGATTISM